MTWPLSPRDLRHRNRAEAHTTTHVHRGHARFDVGADDLGRGVEKSADRIVYEVAAPPGANVWHGWTPDVDSIIVQSVLATWEATGRVQMNVRRIRQEQQP